MKSGRYTIRELLCDGDVEYFCIPEIQRDYVWGEAQVRPFITNIMESMNRPRLDLNDIPQNHRDAYAAFLEQSARYNIGFIYAYFDRAVPERFFLIDGQQRLTTLYLFLAVLAAKGKEESLCGKFISRYFRQRSKCKGPDSHQLKVDYKVREVAHIVLLHVIFDLTASNDNPVSRDYVKFLLNGTWNWENKIRPDWWQRRFENDVTIKSIFQNISLMANLLSGRFHESDKLYKLFNYIENHVEVWYFDTNLSQQGEELYIYMNSRGEQLSYNENRRAACLALCDYTDKKKESAKEWDDILQNNFWKWGRDVNPSADKGLDLFLHSVEMMIPIKDESKTAEDRGNAWRDFIENGKIIDCQASTDMLKEYFSYSKALTAFDNLSETQLWKDQIKKFLHGEWVSTPRQIEAIRVFVVLELLKGQENVNEELKKNFRNCQLFFNNLLRHENVAKSPKDYIYQFVRLAEFCRSHSCNILALVDAADFKSLITDEEKWRLRLLNMRSQNYGADDVQKTLTLLDDISAPEVLRGEVSLLFSVAFDGNMEAILEHCSHIRFDELKADLDKTKNVFCCYFERSDVFPETVRKLLMYGDYSIQSGSGAWYTCELGLTQDKNKWLDTWSPRVRPQDTSLAVNSKIVNFLRNNGNVPDTIANKDRMPGGFEFLQRIAANEDAGNRLFRMIWKDSCTEGRFRAIGGWKPEFKGYKSILWFLSEELRNGISHNGVN